MEHVEEISPNSSPDSGANATHGAALGTQHVQKTPGGGIARHDDLIRNDISFSYSDLKPSYDPHSPVASSSYDNFPVYPHDGRDNAFATRTFDLDVRMDEEGEEEERRQASLDKLFSPRSSSSSVGSRSGSAKSQTRRHSEMFVPTYAQGGGSDVARGNTAEFMAERNPLFNGRRRNSSSTGNINADASFNVRGATKSRRNSGLGDYGSTSRGGGHHEEEALGFTPTAHSSGRYSEANSRPSDSYRHNIGKSDGHIYYRYICAIRSSAVTLPSSQIRRPLSLY